MSTFSYFCLSGVDANKFLKGQLTCSLDKLTTDDNNYQAAAICNLKGRVHFGIWITKAGNNSSNDAFNIVISDDCKDDLLAHIKKYAAFSKVEISTPASIYPCVINGVVNEAATFSTDAKFDNEDQSHNWQTLSIATGNYWITADTKEIFQPQELRLHQRGGVDYDKGCYLGQEVVARIYFKSAPKAFLHRVESVEGLSEAPKAGDEIASKVQVVNAVKTTNGFEALVVARPEAIEASELKVLPLPPALQEDVARH